MPIANSLAYWVDDLMDFSTGGLYEWVCLGGLVSLPIVCGSFSALGSVLLLIYILCYLSHKQANAFNWMLMKPKWHTKLTKAEKYYKQANAFNWMLYVGWSQNDILCWPKLKNTSLLDNPGTATLNFLPDSLLWTLSVINVLECILQLNWLEYIH